MPSCSTVVGQVPGYTIHRIDIDCIDPATVLGVTVDARRAAPPELGAVEKAVVVKTIDPQSPMDEAGVEAKDLFCQPNAEVVVHHQLLSQTVSNTPQWKAMAYEDFVRTMQQRPCRIHIARRIKTPARRPLGVDLSATTLATIRKTFGKATETERQELLRNVRREAQRHFETEKELVLEAVPSEYRRHFGAMGFVQWPREGLKPVLVVSPYAVPPSHRSEWMERFLKARIIRLKWWRSSLASHILSRHSGSNASTEVPWRGWSIGTDPAHRSATRSSNMTNSLPWRMVKNIIINSLTSC